MAYKKTFTDYEETDTDIILRFKIPDVVKEHLAIRATKDRIFIQLDKKNEAALLEDDFLRKEESITAISREILLPAEIEPKKTKTRYKSGIFEVKMKKAI